MKANVIPAGLPILLGIELAKSQIRVKKKKDDYLVRIMKEKDHLD